LFKNKLAGNGESQDQGGLPSQGLSEKTSESSRQAVWGKLDDEGASEDSPVQQAGAQGWEGDERKYVGKRKFTIGNGGRAAEKRGAVLSRGHEQISPHQQTEKWEGVSRKIEKQQRGEGEGEEVGRGKMVVLMLGSGLRAWAKLRGRGG